MRHFLKGLPDQQTAVAVGMKDPQTLEEACAALKTYRSLRDDLGRPPRARVATAVDDQEAQFVTHLSLKQFSEELITSFDKGVGKLESMRKSFEKISCHKSQSKADVECYSYHDKGLYVCECPLKDAKCSGN